MAIRCVILYTHHKLSACVLFVLHSVYWQVVFQVETLMVSLILDRKFPHSGAGTTITGLLSVVGAQITPKPCRAGRYLLCTDQQCPACH